MNPRVALLVLGLAISQTSSHANPVPEDAKTKPTETTLDLHFVDEGWIRVKVKDTDLTLTTKYGKAQIPWADVEKVEFAARTSAEMEARITKNVGNLGNPDFKTREEATEDLKKIGPRAYASCLKAAKSSDPEVARRAGEAAASIKARTPANRLIGNEFDVVYTKDSKLVGKFDKLSVLVKTTQFGDQNVNLYDLLAVKQPGAKLDMENAEAAPANLSAFPNQVGKEFVFKVTGGQPPMGGVASIWGDENYTLDSNLSVAVVHAGLAQPGETVVVRVRIIASPPNFASTTKNGVTSTAYGNPFQPGAYHFVR